MARKVRVQYPGAIYHVMNRGDHSEAEDSDLFLTTLGEASAKIEWQVHSYCLKAQSWLAGTLLIKTCSS
jgi:putative transposase